MLPPRASQNPGFSTREEEGQVDLPGAVMPDDDREFQAAQKLRVTPRRAGGRRPGRR